MNFISISSAVSCLITCTIDLFRIWCCSNRSESWVSGFPLKKSDQFAVAKFSLLVSSVLRADIVWVGNAVTFSVLPLTSLKYTVMGSERLYKLPVIRDSRTTTTTVFSGRSLDTNASSSSLGKGLPSTNS